MELTIYAAWLNEVFALFDSFLLGLHHELALAYSDVLTPVADFLGAAGHFGVIFIALAVLLLFFRKTRMAGVAILVSIAIAGGLSEFVIKDIVARPRPFMMSDTFNAWWQFVGSPSAHSTSFPSGHVAGCTAAVIALAYAARRWWVSLLGVVMVVLMAMDRMYLMVHYPSDVLAGFILGFLSGIVGYAIVQGIFRLLGKHPDQLADAKAAASSHGRQVPIPRGVQGQRLVDEARAQRSAGFPAAAGASPAPSAANPASASNAQTRAIPPVGDGTRVHLPSNAAKPSQSAVSSNSQTQAIPAAGNPSSRQTAQRIEDLRR